MNTCAECGCKPGFGGAMGERCDTCYTLRPRGNKRKQTMKTKTVTVGNVNIGKVRRTPIGVELVEWPKGTPPTIVRGCDNKIEEIQHELTEAEARAWTTAITGVLE